MVHGVSQNKEVVQNRVAVAVAKTMETKAEAVALDLVQNL
jgi:hypothetical protein